MKLIRCTVHPFQLDQVVDALEAFDISNLTVTGAGERCCKNVTGAYRGQRYKIRLLPTSIIDITAADDQVDGIVSTLTRLCSFGEQCNDGRILVMPVNEWYTVRPRERHIA
jgi:nitrogen regulatory protein P-II 1